MIMSMSHCHSQKDKNKYLSDVFRKFSRKKKHLNLFIFFLFLRFFYNKMSKCIAMRIHS
jgi:hypothetical protein